MTIGINAGTAHITVKPSLRGWTRALEQQMQQATRRSLDPDRIVGDQMRRAGRRAGDDYASGLDRAVRSKVRRALEALPAVEVDANTGPAEREVARLRGQLETLSRKRIGIDVSAAVALAELAQVEAELERVGTESANIDVNANTTLARAQLAAIRREVEVLDGRDVRVKVDVDDQATPRLLAATAASGGLLASLGRIVLLGSALLPVAAAVTTLTTSLLSATAAAGLGGGVLLAALLGNIIPVVKAQKELGQKQEAAATAANTYRNAQNGARDALRGLAQAQKSASRSIASAEEQVRSAQQRARQAQDDLNTARDAARERLAAYSRELRRASLDERGAALAVTQAQESLNAVLSDPTATQLQIDLARQSLAESQFGYDEARRRRSELRAQAAADRAAGVEGDRGVRDAKERLAEANRGVAAAETQVAQARADAADQIAAAQTRVADAQAAAAEAGRKYAAAQAEVATRTGKINGPARVFVAGLKAAAAGWAEFRKATAAESFGLAARVLRMFGRLMPALAPLARVTARAFGVLLDDLEQFSGRKGKSFLRWLEQRAPGAIITFGRSIGNLLLGAAGLVHALTDLDTGFYSMTKRFAAWGQSAGENSTVMRFLRYAQKSGPAVAKFFSSLGDALANIVTAAGPIGTFVLGALTMLLDGIAAIPTDVLQAFLIGLAAFGVVAPIFAAVAGAVATFFGVLATGGTVLGGVIAVLGGLPVVLAAIVTGIVVGLVVAYKKIDWFRNAVNATVRFIGKAFTWLWGNVIKPVLAAIGTAITWTWDHVIKPVFRAWRFYLTRVLGPALRWLWTKVVGPVLSAIGKVISWTWNRIVKPAFRGWWFYVTKVLAPALSWLWKKVVGPVFRGIGRTIKAAWTGVIRPVFRAVRDFVLDTLVPAFRNGVRTIGQLFARLRRLIATPARFIVETVWNDGLQPVLSKIPGLKGVKQVALGKEWGSYARGGVLPGYTPGRDVHRFVSPTGGVLNLSGGEGVLIPQATRALGGAKGIAFLNGWARAGRALSLQSLLEQSHRRGGVVYVDGEPMSRVAAAQLAVAENASGINHRVMQGSYQAPTSYSGRSHTGGGVMDTAPGSFLSQSWLRRVGFAAWARNIAGAKTAGSGAHVHSVSTIDPAAAGNSQVAAFRAGGDGLGGRDYGPNPPPSTKLLAQVARLAKTDLGSAATSPGDGNPLSRLAGAIKSALSVVKSFPGWLKTLRAFTAPWGGVFAGVARHLGGKVRAKINGLVPGSPIPDVFDRGGLARGTGLMAKATIRPERVLGPDMTAAFERQLATLESWDRTAAMVNGSLTAGPAGPTTVSVSRFRITDWREGYAEMELIAANAAEDILDGRAALADRTAGFDQYAGV